MSWQYEGNEIDSIESIPKEFQDSYGFVYNIIVSGKHKKTGKVFHGEYIGMKSLGSITYPEVSKKRYDELKEKGEFVKKTKDKAKSKKGKIVWKYKRRSMKETNWKVYTGSSKKLNEDIKNGAEITKYILKFCPDISTLRYWEHKMILCTGAMEDERFYNDYTQIKVFKKNIINKL